MMERKGRQMGRNGGITEQKPQERRKRVLKRKEGIKMTEVDEIEKLLEG